MENSSSNYKKDSLILRKESAIIQTKEEKVGRPSLHIAINSPLSESAAILSSGTTRRRLEGSSGRAEGSSLHIRGSEAKSPSEDNRMLSASSFDERINKKELNLLLSV